MGSSGLRRWVMQPRRITLATLSSRRVSFLCADKTSVCRHRWRDDPSVARANRKSAHYISPSYPPLLLSASSSHLSRLQSGSLLPTWAFPMSFVRVLLMSATSFKYDTVVTISGIPGR
ncbi:hypothetical protein LZ32DRAFT_610934 [Colletotrichum eremochloae]|nr:hypothetical protein LZ32DRAFT_610934 [Colletotrichum eremochloae]